MTRIWNPLLDEVILIKFVPGGKRRGHRGSRVSTRRLHALNQSRRTLWQDEASTYWAIQSGAAQIVHGVRTDGTPPFYFPLVTAVTHLFGTSELALRLVSLVAATALVPAVFVVARRLWSDRTALVAATLAAISPLVHFYAGQACSYALVQLETVAVVYVLIRSLLEPARRRWWAALAVALAIKLWTHNYAVFLLPAIPLCAALSTRSWRVAVAAAVATLAAFVVNLPWMIDAVHYAGSGVADWIAPYWEATPPAAAVLRSLEVLGVGGRYPPYLDSLALAPALRSAAVLVGLGLPALALLRRRGPASRPQPPCRAGLLAGLLLIPLVGAWCYSLVREPIYLVGRYDTMVLPVFLILAAEGCDALFERTGPRLGALVGAAIVALAVMSSWPALGPTLPGSDDDVNAARYLASEAAATDPVVATGYRRPVVAYYLDRAPHPMALSSFPSAIEEHPGWPLGCSRIGTDWPAMPIGSPPV